MGTMMDPTTLDDELHPQRGASGHGYAWEEEYKRSWDMLLDSSGPGSSSSSLQGIVANLQQQQLLQKRRRLNRDTSAVQRGIIRQVFIVMDMSRCMSEMDMRPTRIDCCTAAVETFVHEFFDQNPLSHVGVIAMRDGGASKWVELSGNPSDLLRALGNRNARTLSGEPSLQNALGLAQASLSHVPMHVSREIIIIVGSLTSCDPGNLIETVDSIVRDRIRVSVIGLAAEMRICKKMCVDTNGKYGVAMNESHLRELIFEHIPPPPLTLSQHTSNIIQMGFPVIKVFDKAVFCSCHVQPVKRGYICPRCSATICEIPSDCSQCSLTLVSSPSLARSYHHLFPVPIFTTEIPTSSSSSSSCFACLVPFPSYRNNTATNTATNTNTNDITDTIVSPTMMVMQSAADTRFACPKCHTQFCLDCDVYIHETLHNCPGCMSRGVSVV